MERRSNTAQALVVREMVHNVEPTQYQITETFENFTIVWTGTTTMTVSSTHWQENSLNYTTSVSPTDVPVYDDRAEIWKILYPNKPIPKMQKGAAKKNIGILNREIKEQPDEDELEDLIRRSRWA